MTVFTASKADVLNNEYKNVNVVVFTPLTTAEVATQAAIDGDGAVYFDTTLNKYKGVEGGVVVTFTTT